MKITDRLLQSFLGDTPFNSRRFTGNAHKSLVESIPSGGMQSTGSEEVYTEREERILFQLRFPSGELLNASVHHSIPKYGSDRFYEYQAGQFLPEPGAGDPKYPMQDRRDILRENKSEQGNGFARIEASRANTSGS